MNYKRECAWQTKTAHGSFDSILWGMYLEKHRNQTKPQQPLSTTAMFLRTSATTTTARAVQRQLLRRPTALSTPIFQSMCVHSCAAARVVRSQWRWLPHNHAIAIRRFATSRHEPGSKAAYRAAQVGAHTLTSTLTAMYLTACVYAVASLAFHACISEHKARRLAKHHVAQL